MAGTENCTRFDRRVTPLNRQRGSALLKIVTVVAAVLLGWFGTGWIIAVLVVDVVKVSEKTLPITVLLTLLSGLEAYLRAKLDNLSGHKALNLREHDRLMLIVARKKRKLLLVSVFYIVSAMYAAVIPIVSTGTPLFLQAMASLMVVSVVLVVNSWKERQEIDDFKWMLDERVRAEERKREALQRLRPE